MGPAGSRTKQSVFPQVGVWAPPTASADRREPERTEPLATTGGQEALEEGGRERERERHARTHQQHRNGRVGGRDVDAKQS